MVNIIILNSYYLVHQFIECFCKVLNISEIYDFRNPINGVGFDSTQYIINTPIIRHLHERPEDVAQRSIYRLEQLLIENKYKEESYSKWSSIIWDKHSVFYQYKCPFTERIVSFNNNSSDSNILIIYSSPISITESFHDNGLQKFLELFKFDKLFEIWKKTQAIIIHSQIYKRQL